MNPEIQAVIDGESEGYVVCGDCLDVMADMPEACIDTIITDPPYGLKFMGKDWDHGVPGVHYWEAALRVAKPGAMLLAFGGTRTFHRLTCAIEDAGWEIRDCLMFLYGSGFPKSHNYSIKMHEAACIWYGIMVEYDHNEKAESNTERNVRFVRATYVQTPIYACAKCGQVLQPRVSEQSTSEHRAAWSQSKIIWPEQSGLEGRDNMEATEGKLQGCEICQMSHGLLADGAEGWVCNGASNCNGSPSWATLETDGSCPSYRPQSIEQLYRKPCAVSVERRAQKARGWGTALKPAWEPIILAMKPLDGTFAQNAEKHGVAGLHIDGGRIETQADSFDDKGREASGVSLNWSQTDRKPRHYDGTQGRWPANLILDEEAAGLLDEQSGELTSGKPCGKRHAQSMFIDGAGTDLTGYGDSGGASRFFYTAKASRSERNKGLDNTCTVNYNVDKSLLGDLSCKDVNMVLVQLLQKVMYEVTVSWNIGESGESIVGLCQSDSLFTILTAISKITTSEILRLCPRWFTNGFIPDANYEMGNGGSPAENAENSSQSKHTITNAKLESRRGASLVVSEMLSKISDAENWKPRTNIHSTVKPLALMEYLCKLTATPTGGIVLDPFAGSGTTGMACVTTGRRFIGIDISEEYCEIARNRIRNTERPLFK